MGGKRVNHKLFQQCAVEDVVRVGGHLRGEDGSLKVLATTDGGEIRLKIENNEQNQELFTESENMSAANTDGFLEVVGRKIDATALEMSGFIQFKNAVDVELW